MLVVVDDPSPTHTMGGTRTGSMHERQRRLIAFGTLVRSRLFLGHVLGASLRLPGAAAARGVGIQAAARQRACNGRGVTARDAPPTRRS
jgi:hypothetical protein